MSSCGTLVARAARGSSSHCLGRAIAAQLTTTCGAHCSRHACTVSTEQLPGQARSIKVLVEAKDIPGLR